ncbi:hypothetical protein CC86DRAFT_468316 [Ophiobolus disseminans]|uniref:Uncharacterized protein n=1 Tax=Ophiobolus disseminans TaxID=1469910 RepID=A0A6A6ZSQ9_9PLEO|nr:hypothetical protein CC86DRAFT_468316 [Ophiobolus disseminans]
MSYEYQQDYTNDTLIAGKGYLPYPELINDRWKVTATNDKGLIYTGKDCQQHLVKGSNGEPIQKLNLHWCWDIDIALRGYACSRAYERYMKDPTKPATGCEILLFNRGPSDDWVLAQDANEVPARAAHNALPGACAKCQGSNADSKTHHLYCDQSAKFAFQGLHGVTFKAPVQPVQYKPGMNTKHVLLKRDGYYHDWELSQFPGVELKDVWIPYVGKEWSADAGIGGIPKEQWQGIQKHVETSKPASNPPPTQTPMCKYVRATGACAFTIDAPGRRVFRPKHDFMAHGVWIIRRCDQAVRDGKCCPNLVQLARLTYEQLMSSDSPDIYFIAPGKRFNREQSDPQTDNADVPDERCSVCRKKEFDPTAGTLFERERG